MQKSTRDQKGNTIVAIDGEIGKVDDFYFDDKSWTIRYLGGRHRQLAFGTKGPYLAYSSRQAGFFKRAVQRDTDQEANRGQPQH